MRCSANVRTTDYSLVVARTGGVGRLSLLGCHLRTSAKHRSFAAYRVRAWPGADARWQAPPQAKLARSRGRGPRHAVVQFGAKLVRRVVIVAKLCTFSFGTDTGSKVVRQDHFKNQRV